MKMESLRENFGVGTEITNITRSPEIDRDFKATLTCKQKISRKFSRLPKAGFLQKIASHFAYNELDENNERSIKIKRPSTETRSLLMKNIIKVQITDINYLNKWRKMEQDLNTLYGDLKKYNVNDGIASIESIVPGMLVAVSDHTSDQIGRYRRGRVVKVNQVANNSKLASSLSSVTCDLIDEDRVDNFKGDQIYLLAIEFLKIPSRFFTIQLSRLNAFVGSPKLGRVLETLVINYGRSYSMIIKKELQRHTLEVVLMSNDLPCSVNDYLLSELFKADFGSENWFFSSQIRGSIFQSVILCYFGKDGRVGLRLKSREMGAIEDHLKEAQENFSAYLLVQATEQERLKVGETCLAKVDPSKNRVLRCKILSILASDSATLTSKSCTVNWIDAGGQSDIPASEIIPAKFVSRVLSSANPQCVEFQLANIESLHINSNILSILPVGSEVSMRIVDTGSLVTNAAPVRVELYKYRPTNYGEEFHSFNNQLLQLAANLDADVKPSAIMSQFVPRKCLIQLSDIIHISMNYLTRDWSLSSESRRNHLTVKEGDQISFFVSQVRSSIEFYIHPWITKDKITVLKIQMTDYCENERPEWVSGERDECLENLPSGSSVVYFKNGVYNRVKLISNLVDENSGKERDLAMVLLLDEGRYEMAEVKNLIRINQPWPLFTALSPQGAVGRWKHAMDLHGELKSKVTSSNTESIELEATLRHELEIVDANIFQQKLVTAFVDSVNIDSNGQTDFQLSFSKPKKVVIKEKNCTLK